MASNMCVKCNGLCDELSHESLCHHCRIPKDDPAHYCWKCYERVKNIEKVERASKDEVYIELDLDQELKNLQDAQVQTMGFWDNKEDEDWNEEETKES